MKKILLFFSFILLTVCLTGCATIMTGTNHSLTINSNVEGVKVYIDEIYRGSTPIRLDLSTEEKVYTIKIEAEGFVPYIEVVQRKASGWVWGNIFLGGFIGLGIDMITGGLYVYEKDNITGNLVRSPVGTLEKK